MRIRTLVAAVLSVAVLPAVVLISCGVATAGDPVSPLFAARLEATLAGWEIAAVPAGEGGDGEVPWWPASAQPASLCVGSLCVGSLCVGSLCVSSDCVGSGCVNSGCAGSGCVGSVCLGSGCAGSMCAGSACLGITLCVRVCGRDGGPTIPQDPSGSIPSSSPMICPEN
jgi:hypothetical protein